MEVAVIASEPRSAGGRHANERLRRRGMVPAVIYGRKEPPQTVALSRHDLGHALQALTHVVTLRVDGQENKYLLKDVQFDALQREPIHVDLLRVSMTERVRVRVPIELKGDAKGLHEGGVLVQPMADLEVECLPLEIPTSVRANIAELGIGQSVHVSQIELPPGVTAVADPNAIVVLVQAKREEVPAAPVEAVAEVQPEVIGRQAKVEAPGEGESEA